MKAGGGGGGQAAPEEGSCLHQFLDLCTSGASVQLHAEASINLYPARQAGAPRTAHSRAAKKEANADKRACQPNAIMAFNEC